MGKPHILRIPGDVHGSIVTGKDGKYLVLLDTKDTELIDIVVKRFSLRVDFKGQEMDVVLNDVRQSLTASDELVIILKIRGEL